jgi:hypothetical protein
MTLPNGLTERRTKTGLYVTRVHYSADPERDPEINPAWYQQERAKYTSQGAWDREQEIIHDAGGGERIFVETLVKHWSKIVLEDGFEIPPQWRRIGGADHGKANPTAFLEAAIDYDGILYICAEYYQPGLSPDQHLDFLWQEWPELFDIPEIYADPSIFFKTQAQSRGAGFKAISEIYAEEREMRTGTRPGLTNLISAPDNTEILGMERILKHWHDLDHREPSLKIICPRRYDTSKKRYGLHRDGCPNLIWELRRARREELSATQLQNRNPSERIVDRDNHLRDCLKYIVLSLPDPTEKSREEQAADSVRGLDPTSAMIRYQQFMEREAPPRPLKLGRRRLTHYWRRRR